GRAEDFAVFLKIALLAVLAAVGLHTASAVRFQPLVDQGGSSILLGGALIFVAYEGFQLITNAVCETRDPGRNIPRGLYGSIILTSVIYVVIAVVAVGNLDVAAIHAAEEYALAAVARPVLGNLGVVLVDIAAMLATASAINATIFGASHLAFEIASDNLAPGAFSFRNRAGVPASSAVVIALLALALTARGGLELIAAFSSMTFLLVSVGVSIANLRLRAETRSATAPVVLGLALMGATIFLLIYYLARHNTGALFFALSAYGVTGLSFILFRRISRRRRQAG
ncbi:MAG: APC family permease, partial [Myxococcota bacterium]